MKLLSKVKPASSEAPTFYETFRDLHCKTEAAKAMIDIMIVADAKIDIFEHYQVDAIMEITFLGVLKEFRKYGIGFNLVKYSLQIGTELKNKKDFSPRPLLASAMWSAVGSQKIGSNLKFDVIYQEPFSNYTYNGKTFAEKIGNLNAFYQVAVKRL